MYLPKSLINFIEEEHPPFQVLSDVNKRRIAYMLWLWSSERYRHISSRYGSAFSSKFLLNIWGNLATQRKVSAGYFSVGQGGNISGESSSYIPMDFLGRALIRCLESSNSDTLIELNGYQMKMPRNVILSRASNSDPEVKNAKRSVWVGTACATSVLINAKELSAFMSQTNDLKHQLAALRLLKVSRNLLCEGRIPVQYEQKSTGRLVEVLSNIQNTPREVLSYALHGCWDYDLSNAHFSILKAWSNKLGELTPVIDHYLKNKRQLRREIASDCKSDEADIKECLIALLYGAALSSHEKYASIGRTLGRSKAELFNKHAFVVALNREIKRLRGHIVRNMKQHSGRYCNAMNISVAPNGKKNEQAVLLCHALQGYEALALKTVMDHCGEKILLPMHDGWISSERLDRLELERLIKEATGFDLEVEEKQLPKFPPKWVDSQTSDVTQNSLVKANTLRINFEEMFDKPSIVKPGSFILSTGPEWNEPKGIFARRGRRSRV